MITKDSILCEVYQSKAFKQYARGLLDSADLANEMVSYVVTEVMINMPEQMLIDMYVTAGKLTPDRIIAYACRTAFNLRGRKTSGFWRSVRGYNSLASRTGELTEDIDLPDSAEVIPVEITDHEHTMCLLFHGCVTPEAVAEVRSRNKYNKANIPYLDTYLNTGTMRKAAGAMNCGHVTIHNKLKAFKDGAKAQERA